MLILADTSIWIDHLRRPNAQFALLIKSRRLLMHPFVVGELALGCLKNRNAILLEFQRLPRATVVEHQSLLDIVDRFTLFGSGLGYVDAHLLASAHTMRKAALWTRDRRLHSASVKLG